MEPTKTRSRERAARVVVLGCARDVVGAADSIASRASVEIIVVAEDEQALEWLRRHRRGLLIVGSQRQQGSPEQLCKAIRDDPTLRQTSILCIADEGEWEQATKLKRAGANGVLCRPVDRIALNRAIAKLVMVPLRAHVRLPTRVRVHRKRGDLVGHSHNISESGMLLETEANLEVGGEIKLSFHLPGGGSEVATKARVVRTAREIDGRPAAGLQFTELSEQDRKGIMELQELRTPSTA